jgi:hypothetical protein
MQSADHKVHAVDFKRYETNGLHKAACSARLSRADGQRHDLVFCAVEIAASTRLRCRLRAMECRRMLLMRGTSLHVAAA